MPERSDNYSDLIPHHRRKTKVKGRKTKIERRKTKVEGRKTKVEARKRKDNRK